MKKRIRCAAVVPAAGMSSRMQGINKLFYEVCGMPVIVITLKALQSSELIDEIVVSARESDISDISRLCAEYGIEKATHVVEGGKTRLDSVLAGIKHTGRKHGLIAIHDAARPLVSGRIIEETITLASKWSAAAPAVPVKDTIKLASGNIVSKTLPRENLFAIQTPQVFERNLIYAALTQASEKNLSITDDCSAVELLGMKVVLSRGEYENIKITTAEDILLVDSIMRSREAKT